MRILVLVVLAGAATAQAPSSFKPKPFGNLKQVMRGILRPNSDIIFNVQSTPPKNDMEWNGIENAAVTLEGAANLITLPGRLREDGQPVPVQRANWNKWAQGVVDAGQACYKAATSWPTPAPIVTTCIATGRRGSSLCGAALPGCRRASARRAGRKPGGRLESLPPHPTSSAPSAASHRPTRSRFPHRNGKPSGNRAPFARPCPLPLRVAQLQPK